MNTKNILFKDSLEEYLPIYFHFLDGFLNPDYGSSSEQTLNFILKNNNFLIPNGKPITYLTFDYISKNDYKKYTYENEDDYGYGLFGQGESDEEPEPGQEPEQEPEEEQEQEPEPEPGQEPDEDYNEPYDQEPEPEEGYNEPYDQEEDYEEPYDSKPYDYEEGQYNISEDSNEKAMNDLEELHALEYDYDDRSELKFDHVNCDYKINFIELNFYKFIKKNDMTPYLIIVKSLNDKKIIDSLLDLFKYCICQIIADKHATSLLIFQNYGKLNILSFNSGSGINNHKEYTEKSGYYLPYYGISLDINMEGLHIILSLLLLNKLYNITKSNHLFIDIQGEIFLNPEIINLVKLIKILNKKINFHDIGFKFKLENGETGEKFSYDDISEERYKCISVYDTGIKSIYIGDTKQPIININKFYDILINELKNHPEFLFNLDNDSYVNIEPFNKFNKYVKNNIILHNKDKKLYINDQKSGSCTWFSIYWPLIFYHIFIDNNYIKYCNHVISIYNNFILILKRIFNSSNLNNLYFNDNESVKLIKNLYSKFINIELLELSTLPNKNDMIYNSNIIYNVNNIVIDSARSNYNILFKIELDNYSFNEILKVYLNIYNTNQGYECVYNLFIKNKNIFNNNYLFNEKNIKYHLFQDGITILGKFVIDHFGDLPSIKNKIIKLLKNFYDFTNSLECENMYINKYISIALFFDHNLSDDNIILFINFMHKFNLFILIYNKIHELFNWFDSKTSVNQKIYNDIFINIIVPLFNDQQYQEIIYNRNNELKIIFQFNYISHLLGDNISNDFNITNDYSRKISDYKNLMIILYKNPKYIHCTFNNNNININSCLFIKLNKKIIFENVEYLNNIIEFYASMYFEDDTNYNIIYNLQILICKTLSLGDDYYYNNMYNRSYNNLVYEFIYENTSDILGCEEFKLKLEKLKSLYKNKQLFCKELLKQNDEIKFLYNKENYLMNKYSINIELYYKLKNISFSNNLLINNHVLNNYKNIFLISNTELLIINNNYIIKFINYDDIVEDEDKDDHYDYDEYDEEYEKYYDKFLLRKNKLKSKKESLKMHKGGADGDNEFKIKKIYFNNHLVEKFENIIYPFKYIIPTDCLYFIYNINDVYHITYLIDNESVSILGKSSLDNGVYTISINKNNQMYPNNSDFKLFSQLCENFGVNYFNVLYVKYHEKEIDRYLYLSKYYYNLLLFDRKKFYNEELDSNIEYTDIKLLNNNKDNIINFVKSTMYEDINESYSKILFKISKCKLNFKNIQRIKDKFKSIISKLSIKINYFSNYIKDKSIYYLLDDYSLLYSYLLNIKIYNTCNNLLYILGNKPKNFCSQVKIYNEQFKIKKKIFKYKFEAIFELILGSELFEEQMFRYTSIINSYCPDYINIPKQTIKHEELNIINYEQTGGYPLHHLMMGKGKSAVITPLLSLYFILNLNKRVYIIVPSHLVKQTNNTIKSYAFIFNIKLLVLKDNKNDDSDDEHYKYYDNEDSMINDITKYQLIICSDAKIKELFLYGLFTDNIMNLNSVFLIDEFDSILDPIKSNFNIIKSFDQPMKDIYDIIKPSSTIDENIKFINEGNINVNNILISNDLKNILDQINNKILVENINWGIHPIKMCAIPYRSKDNPLLNSTFSSGINTVFLTLYYFIVLNKYKINSVIVNFIIKNNMFYELFERDEPSIISIENIELLLVNDGNRLDFFNKLFDIIFNNLNLTDKQYNTSFVDILNIDNIFKIGYSGTLNINLPEIFSGEVFDEKVIDEDEKINIKHAILESKIINYINEENNFFDDICINDYHAIIDTIGYFKNYKNEDIATKINNYFGSLRDIIFIDEKDNKLVIVNNKIVKYNEDNNYKDPLIYYSQAHIIGIDINQNLYSIMNGLCIVNNVSEYTLVAQSMCRLRKLNMGHVITFLYIGNNIHNVIEFFDLLNKNEELSKKSKKYSLIYQTLKSEVRKIIPYSNSKLFKENYEETVKFYYLLDNKTKMYKLLNNEECEYENTDFLSEIIEIDQHDIKIKTLFNKINNIENLKKLVYNIGSLSFDTNYDQYNEDEKEIHKNRNIEIELVKYMQIPQPIINYDYKVYDFSILVTQFIEKTIKVNDHIRCLPNIFSQASLSGINKNNSGFLFILFEQFDNLLIIPGYLISHFYNTHHVFNHKLSKINSYKNNEFKNNILNKYKNLDFFKILLNISKILNIESYKNSFEGFILSIIIMYINFEATNITSIHNTLITGFLNNSVFTSRIEQYRNKYYFKALKYKNKYLSLKYINNV